MPVDYAQLLEVANGVRGRIAQENELTARQARSFVRALQITWQVPPIQWRENETSSQIDDATRLIHTGQIFREAEGVESNNALDCFRRAGELLEWLARSSDRMKSSVSIELLAAAAFQLGGLPAMASALINQVGVEDHGTALFSAYLAADFDGALHNVSRFWVDNFELTDMGVSQQLLTADEGADVSWYFTVEIVRCIGLISDSLRRGNDERLELAIRKLAALDSFAVRSVSGDVSLLISLLLTVSQGFQKSSIHRRLKRLGDLIPQHRDKLVRYGRVQYSRGRGILWSSQERGIDKLLANTSFALCTPTGSGKTLIANLAIIKELLLRNDDVAPLALYLVPSRALAGEVEA
jgi:hypothetical protein